jgi:hypothetical protein
LKVEPSIAARAIRAASLTISLVSLVTFATVFYSAYTDYNSVLQLVGSQSGGAVSETVTSSGGQTTLHINATVPNNGIYPLQVSISCPHASSQPGVSCVGDSAMVQPGQTGEIHLSVSVSNSTLSSLGLGALNLDGEVDITLVPFASLSMLVNLGTLIQKGGT